MEKTLFIGGAHRGGRAVTENALKELTDLKVGAAIIADPKEDRALGLAEVWRDRGVKAEGLNEACEKAIESLDADAVMLTIDTIKPMAEILKRKPLPTQWQLMARGLGINGPVVSIAGTVAAGNSQERESSIKLIVELSSFIMPRSSSSIRENPLNGDILYIARKRASQHSVERLKVIDRDPKDIKNGSLNFFWGVKVYPLVVQERPASQRWKEIRRRSLETELTTELKDTNGFVTAIVGQKAVDFFVIDSLRGRRRIKFHLPFIHTFSDNTNMLGIAAPAVVTD